MIGKFKKYCRANYNRLIKRLLVKGRFPSAPKNNGFLILNYHSIQMDNAYPFAISPQEFEFQMKYLADNFELRTVEDIVEHISTGKKVSDTIVGITFDDGYIDNYEYALPVLQKYDIPAMFFVNPFIIDLQYESFMPWEKIIEISNMDLIQIGSHGLSHLPLSVLQSKDIETEISKSKTILEGRLKRDITCFAYPFGMVHSECQEFLMSSGYRAAFITGINKDKAIAPYNIGRLVIEKNNSVPDYFEIAVARSIRSYQHVKL